jgi:FeS assembly protein IscX
MPPTFDWDDVEEIGIQLADKYPDIDPLTVRFTDLHKWVCELPNFTGDQMAWHEEYKDRQT